MYIFFLGKLVVGIDISINGDSCDITKSNSNFVIRIYIKIIL